MSEVSFARDIACGRDRIRELLLNHEFLTQFVKLQHPVEYDISVNVDESTSTMDWVVSTERIPGIVRRFVGETIPIHMVITSPGITPDQDGSVTLDLEGKIKGRLQASLSAQSIDQHLADTAIGARGTFNISAGLLSGKASDMARDHLVVPLLGELADLLQEWSAGPSF
jgi:Protein of unknown function (DUF2505)